MKNEEAPPLIDSNNIETKEESLQKSSIKSEIIISKEEEDITNELSKKNYPQNLYKFEFDFFDTTITTDCIFYMNGRKNYVYFNVKTLQNYLEKELAKIIKYYPKNYEDLKQPLEDYMKEKQENRYFENRNIFTSIFLRLKFLFSKGERFNEDVKSRIKHITFLLNQINEHNKIEANKEIKYRSIAMIDSLTLKFTPQTDQIFDDISEKIGEINIKTANINEINDSLQTLREAFEAISKEINDNKKLISMKSIFSDNNGDIELKKKILFSYLAKEIDPKLSKIEERSPPRGSKVYEKMKEFRSELNRIIIENIDTSENNREFFFNEEFSFKIIKDTKKEKIIMLIGMQINQFYSKLYKNYEDLRDHLLKFDKDEFENEIGKENKNLLIKKFMSKIENFDDIEKRLLKEKNDLEKKILNKSISIAKNGVKIYKGNYKEKIIEKNEIKNEEKNEDKNEDKIKDTNENTNEDKIEEKNEEKNEDKNEDNIDDTNENINEIKNEDKIEEKNEIKNREKKENQNGGNHDIENKEKETRINIKTKTENIDENKIENIFESIKDIGDKAFEIKDINIEKQFLEKAQKMINYQKGETIKLIKEFELIDKIQEEIKRKKEFDINSINGIQITKQINDLENQLTDLYSVEIIY